LEIHQELRRLSLGVIGPLDGEAAKVLRLALVLEIHAEDDDVTSGHGVDGKSLLGVRLAYAHAVPPEWICVRRECTPYRRQSRWTISTEYPRARRSSPSRWPMATERCRPPVQPMPMVR